MLMRIVSMVVMSVVVMSVVVRTGQMNMGPTVGWTWVRSIAMSVGKGIAYHQKRH
jgi:hypothetical protein